MASSLNLSVIPSIIQIENNLYTVIKMIEMPTSESAGRTGWQTLDLLQSSVEENDIILQERRDQKSASCKLQEMFDLWPIAWANGQDVTWHHHSLVGTTGVKHVCRVFLSLQP